MKEIKAVLFLLMVTVVFCTKLCAQELLDKVPNTREEFIATEKKVLATIDWLENTPLNQQEEKRKEQNALLIQWVTNTPTITLEINADILPFVKKSPELLPVFMGGWTRYSLQNNYSKNTVEGSLAGLKSAIKVYKTGVLNKDKEMEKLVEKSEKGQLETWVKKSLGK